MKLATYCCDTRFSYLLRAMSPGFIEEYTRLLDKSLDDFTAHTLCFEQDNTKTASTKNIISLLVHNTGWASNREVWA